MTPVSALAIVFAATACTGADRDANDTRSGDEAMAGGAVHVVDAEGDTVTLDRPARRIVSLVPSATETLRAIGAVDALAGRTEFDTESWAASIPSVGGGIEPNLEAVVALEPDLVIRFGGTQDPRTPARLAELGIPSLSVRPDHVRDIYETAEMLGLATGHEAGADSLVGALRDGLHDVEEAAAALPRKRIAYVLGGTPPWVSGPGTYIDEIVSLAGGDNVFSDLDALYAPVSPEQLRTRDIDVVLLASAESFDASLTPGARVAVIGDALEIPGPDVVDAAYRVAEALHGRRLR
ncbi:MAG: helical backbone metal receptor [Gemmatimonadota bacterium]|jgi:iron complex transport system substrate-binding protein